ncbi:MAG: hypothetical protein M3310_00535, partial [Actinomycetota bacterium]|nr:hypothetical protein [Actinomycetota bacterium]
PASEGTGVIAGGGVRAVLELGGVRDILAKSLGTTNPINLLKATIAGLQSLRTPDEVARSRGKTVAEVLPVRKRVPGDEGENDGTDTAPAAVAATASGDGVGDGSAEAPQEAPA